MVAITGLYLGLGITVLVATLTHVASAASIQICQGRPFTLPDFPGGTPALMLCSKTAYFHGVTDKDVPQPVFKLYLWETTPTLIVKVSADVIARGKQPNERNVF